MRKQNVFNSPKLVAIRKKKRRLLGLKVFFYFFIIFSAMGGLAYLLRLPEFNISTIKITGNRVLSTETLTATVEESLAGEYFWLMPKKNLIFYPKQTIRQSIADQFGRTKNIVFRIEKGGILEVGFAERETAYLWCIEPNSEIGAEKCYFMDDAGYIFEPAPYFSGDVYFKFYGGLAVANPLGQFFLKNKFVELLAFIKSLESLNLDIVGVSAVNPEGMKILLNPASNSAHRPEIIFKIQTPFSELLENLETVLTTEPFRNDIREKYHNLEYIDLRFGNKVYYKFK